MSQMSQFPMIAPLENILKKQSSRDLWHLRHWLQYWQLRTWINDNLCYLTINCDTGQHSQFLRCFVCYYSYYAKADDSGHHNSQSPGWVEMSQKTAKVEISWKKLQKWKCHKKNCKRGNVIKQNFKLKINYNTCWRKKNIWFAGKYLKPVGVEFVLQKKIFAVNLSPFESETFLYRCKFKHFL